MDWANERYVRVYTRDTTTWKLVDWRARTVLLHLFRKVDRAGVIEVDGTGAEGLAAVLELPLEIVEAGLAQLTDPRRGVVVATPNAYVIPNFIEAQEAVQTEAHRSREYRARKRERAMSQGDSVTFRDDPVTPRGATVTPRHEPSRDVTPIRSEPNQANPNQAGEEITPPPAAPKRSAPKRVLPEGWAPTRTDANVAAELAARERGVDLQQELSKLRDWATSVAAKKTDWDATWRNWTRNAKPSGPRLNGQRASNGTRAGDLLEWQMQRVRDAEADEAEGDPRDRS